MSQSNEILPELVHDECVERMSDDEFLCFLNDSINQCVSTVDETTSKYLELFHQARDCDTKMIQHYLYFNRLQSSLNSLRNRFFIQLGTEDRTHVIKDYQKKVRIELLQKANKKRKLDKMAKAETEAVTVA